MIALETLRAHKLRSFLTLLGVILSVSTLIVVVSMVEGTNKYVADKIANFGSNVFLIMRFPIITSREMFVKLDRTNKNITWDDYEYVRDNMTMAKAVGLETRRNGKVKYKTEITDADNEHRSNITMIGADVAKRFFAGVDPLGKSIYIDGESYEVVGVAKELGSTFGQSQDGFVYMPIQTYRKVYGNNESANINIQALAADMMQPAEDEARMLMRARHHLKPKEDDNFGVVEPTALMELWLTLTGTLANGSIGVVFVFLIIGGIVIMNIMLASVTERTREIGVRKSLGATRRDVLLQFMVESSVMAAVGGIIGVVVAYKASKLNPIEALRFET